MLNQYHIWKKVLNDLKETDFVEFPKTQIRMPL